MSITVKAAICIEAVHKAPTRYGKAEIFNTYEGKDPTISFKWCEAIRSRMVSQRLGVSQHSLYERKKKFVALNAKGDDEVEEIMRLNMVQRGKLASGYAD